MPELITDGVRLSEVAAATGQRLASVESDCKEFGIPLFEDWAGQPVVRPGDARELRTGSLRQARDDARADAERRADCRDWEAQRSAAVRAAAEKAHAAEMRRVVAETGSGYAAFAMPAGMQAARSADQAAGQAAHAAGRAFELTHIAPNEYARYEYISAAEAPKTAIGAAANKLRRSRGGKSEQEGGE
ncbi:hypothetical protein ACWGQ5_34065 [Streptomyces sp. NPDC055722]